MDYNRYDPDWKELFVWIAGMALIAFAIGMIFYRHALAAGILSLSGLSAPLWLKRHKIARKKEALVFQFQQALQILSASIAAGKSLESAMADTVNDLEQLFPDPDTLIVREWKLIVHRLGNGVPIEQSFADLARRSGVDDIRNFAEVLAVGKRQGGNLVEIIRRTVQIMSEKMDIQRDLRVMMARKRWESRLLCAAPVVFVALLGYSSSDYMAPLYSGIGRLIMTAALLAIAGCWWIAQRIMDIEV